MKWFPLAIVLLTGCTSVTPERIVDEREALTMRVESIVDKAQAAKRETGRRAWCERLSISEFWKMRRGQQQALEVLCDQRDVLEEDE